MTNIKILKFIILMFILFVLSFIYAVINKYPHLGPSYELGKLTAVRFKYLFKILGFVAMLILIYRFFKK